MSSTHTSLHYHVVFSTKHRRTCLAPEWRYDLHAYIGGTLNGLGAIPREVGGVSDHVHLLASLPPTACLAELFRELKKAASAWVQKRHAKFQWQEGYAAFTVSPSGLEPVRCYVARQEAHHRTRSFSEELVALLEKSGVGYDPRFLE